MRGGVPLPACGLWYGLSVEALSWLWARRCAMSRPASTSWCDPLRPAAARSCSTGHPPPGPAVYHRVRLRIGSSAPQPCPAQLGHGRGRRPGGLPFPPALAVWPPQFPIALRYHGTNITRTNRRYIIKKFYRWLFVYLKKTLSVPYTAE